MGQLWDVMGLNGAVFGCYGTKWGSYGMLWDLIGQLWDVMELLGQLWDIMGLIHCNIISCSSNLITISFLLNVSGESYYCMLKEQWIFSWERSWMTHSMTIL